MVSSRTPEGEAHRCPVCGQLAVTEPAHPLGDSVCPHCGELLLWFRDHVRSPSIEWKTALADLSGDSLDTVELVMELEEEFDITIPDNVAERFQSIEDLIHYIRQQRGESS